MAVETRRRSRQQNLVIVRYDSLRDDWIKGADLIARLVATSSKNGTILVGFPRQWIPIFINFNANWRSTIVPSAFISIVSNLSEEQLVEICLQARQERALRSLPVGHNPRPRCWLSANGYSRYSVWGRLDGLVGLATGRRLWDNFFARNERAFCGRERQKTSRIKAYVKPCRNRYVSAVRMPRLYRMEAGREAGSGARKLVSGEGSPQRFRYLEGSEVRRVQSLCTAKRSYLKRQLKQLVSWINRRRNPPHPITAQHC